MIEAVKLWNEPNNMSHWDFEIDAGWRVYADMVKAAATAVRAENPTLTRVLGGISPIDANFISTLGRRASSSTWTSSPYMAFRSTGITGRFTNGRTSCARSTR